jgi:hypothetical protein
LDIATDELKLVSNVIEWVSLIMLHVMEGDGLLQIPYLARQTKPSLQGSSKIEEGQGSRCPGGRRARVSRWKVIASSRSGPLKPSLQGFGEIEEGRGAIAMPRGTPT